MQPLKPAADEEDVTRPDGRVLRALRRLQNTSRALSAAATSKRCQQIDLCARGGGG
jgi:hypothetical protein